MEQTTHFVYYTCVRSEVFEVKIRFCIFYDIGRREKTECFREDGFSYSALHYQKNFSIHIQQIIYYGGQFGHSWIFVENC